MVPGRAARGVSLWHEASPEPAREPHRDLGLSRAVSLWASATELHVCRERSCGFTLCDSHPACLSWGNLEGVPLAGFLAQYERSAAKEASEKMANT